MTLKIKYTVENKYKSKLNIPKWLFQKKKKNRTFFTEIQVNGSMDSLFIPSAQLLIHHSTAERMRGEEKRTLFKQILRRDTRNCALSLEVKSFNRIYFLLVCVQIPLHWRYSALLSNVSVVFVSTRRLELFRMRACFFLRFLLVILKWISYHLFQFFAELYQLETNFLFATAAAANLSFYRQYFCLIYGATCDIRFICRHNMCTRYSRPDICWWISRMNFLTSTQDSIDPLFSLPNWRSSFFFVCFFPFIFIETVVE